MKRKIVRILLFALALVLLGASVACKKTVVQTGILPDDVTADDLKVSGKVTFTLMTASASETEMISGRAVASAFMQKYPGTSVTVERAETSTYAQRISAGDLGDVFWSDTSMMRSYHYDHNAIMPLDAYLEPLGIDVTEVYTGALDCGKLDGKLYLAPRGIGLHIFVYNADAVEASGVDYDNTRAYDWEEFKSIARQLTLDEDNDGILDQVGCAFRIWWSPCLQVFLRGFGGEWIDSKNHVVHLVDDENVFKGLEEIIAGVNEGWLFPQEMEGMLSGKVREQFGNIASGSANFYASVCFSHFHDMSILNSVGNIFDQIGANFDFAAFPAFPTHTVSCGVTGYSVFNRTKNPDTAAALALFFLTEEGQRAYQGNSGGGVPLVKSLADEEFWRGAGTDWTDKNYDAFLQYADKTKPADTHLQVPAQVDEELSNAKMQQAFADVLNGKTSLADAFGKLQVKANEVWDLYAG